ncbi:actin binding protein [Reticulomyxa filosa]|uniref:Actin binding protein n=1 Tax=Reticulomyxa filosa TaxID=46433 RepID=X6PFM5_RETFI|nr:actin binding protein [Reticulomyxa filosa]|eukprot:ETO36873.1 actin binding protein [Reticulomyxa filosa]
MSTENAEVPQEEEKQKQESEVQQSSGTSADTTKTRTFSDVTSAWKAISADNPQINWCLFGVDKKIELEFKIAGQNGFEELTKYLKGNLNKSSSSELLFGLLRVNSNDRGNSKRAKFVFIRFVGSNVSVMLKGKLTPKLGKIGDAFPVKHLTYDLTEDLVGFTIDAIAREMLRVGGAHKPDSFDFGPNQTFNCQ